MFSSSLGIAPLVKRSTFFTATWTFFQILLALPLTGATVVAPSHTQGLTSSAGQQSGSALLQA